VIAAVDIKRRQLIDADGKVLVGECLHCGKCCVINAKNCEHLAWETLDGEPRSVCRVQVKKPFHCCMYPDPDDVLFSGCGYRWEKK